MQTDKLCTTARSLCNIVAFIRPETAADVHDETPAVHDIHVFNDALHAEALQSGREGGLRCTLHLNQ